MVADNIPVLEPVGSTKYLFRLGEVVFTPSPSRIEVVKLSSFAGTSIEDEGIQIFGAIG